MTRSRPPLPAAPSAASSRAVFTDILRFGPRPRTELAERLGLSGPTITRATRALLDDGLLRELPPVPQRTGRPQEPLDVVEDHARFIGVKVTGDEVYAAVATPRAVVVEDLRAPLPSSRPEGVARCIQDLVEPLAAAHRRVAGVGVSLGAGVADRRTLITCPILGWTGPLPFAELLEDRLHLPVAVENDMTSLLQGILWFGIGRRWDSFLLLTIGAGVGVGVVLDGRVIEGRRHLAGRTGSLPTELRDGRAARLGDVARTGRVLAAAREAGAIGPADDLRTLLAALRAGDPAVRELAEEVAHALAVGAAGLVGVLDPEAVLIGGESAELAGPAAGTFDRVLRERLDPGQREVQVRRLAEDFDEWARGAAVVALQEFIGAR